MYVNAWDRFTASAINLQYSEIQTFGQNIKYIDDKMKQDAYCSRRFLFSKSSTTSSSYHQSQHHSTMLLLLHIRFVWHRISLFLSSVCNTPCTMMVSRIYLLSTKGLVISRVLSSSSPISIPPQSGASLRDR